MHVDGNDFSSSPSFTCINPAVKDALLSAKVVVFRDFDAVEHEPLVHYLRSYIGQRGGTVITIENLVSIKQPSRLSRIQNSFREDLLKVLDVYLTASGDMKWVAMPSHHSFE